MPEPTTRQRPPRVTDEDIEACRTPDGLVRALAILGLINDAGDAVICPECGKSGDLKKFSIKPDGGYKHFGAVGCWGGRGAGINLLSAPPLNLSFHDAVRAIVGKPTSVPVAVPDVLPDINIQSFKATVDPEIYRGILNYGRRFGDGTGVRRAQEFYGQWHIDPDVVAASGAVYITDPKNLAESLLTRYGLARLLASGVFVMNRKDEPMCLISDKWPVIEPARNVAGDVVNLQFRASDAQYRRYLAHQAGKRPYEGSQKFLNVRGVDPTAVGIDEVAQLPEGSQVFVVEGFKDRLAAKTFGMNAVAFPGTGYRPSEDEIAVLRRLNVVLMFDGDEAGQNAVNGVWATDENDQPQLVRPGMVHLLAERGVEDLHVHSLTGGLDVTDQLVSRHARAGCGCANCTHLLERLTA